MELDAHTDLSVGRRIVDWELRGVPVRVEVSGDDATVTSTARATVRVASVRFTHLPKGKLSFRLGLNSTGRRLLARRGRLAVRVRTTVDPGEGRPRTSQSSAVVTAHR